MSDFSWDGVGTRLSLDAKEHLLKQLIGLVAARTGISWRVTSYIRNSPGHADGDAIDVAPDLLREKGDGKYAVDRRSDPVLHFRAPLLQNLMALGLLRFFPLGSLTCLIAVENDHLHMQLVMPKDPRDGGRIIPFPFGKDLTNRYPDSLQRQLRAGMAVANMDK